MKVSYLGRFPENHPGVALGTKALCSSMTPCFINRRMQPGLLESGRQTGTVTNSLSLIFLPPILLRQVSFMQPFQSRTPQSSIYSLGGLCLLGDRIKGVSRHTGQAVTLISELLLYVCTFQEHQYFWSLIVKTKDMNPTGTYLLSCSSETMARASFNEKWLRIVCSSPLQKCQTFLL